jgi:hypothetical protein
VASRPTSDRTSDDPFARSATGKTPSATAARSLLDLTFHRLIEAERGKGGGDGPNGGNEETRTNELEEDVAPSADPVLPCWDRHRHRRRVVDDDMEIAENRSSAVEMSRKISET